MCMHGVYVCMYTNLSIFLGLAASADLVHVHGACSMRSGPAHAHNIYIKIYIMHRSTQETRPQCRSLLQWRQVWGGVAHERASRRDTPRALHTQHTQPLLLPFYGSCSILRCAVGVVLRDVCVSEYLTPGPPSSPPAGRCRAGCSRALVACTLLCFTWR